MEEGNAAQPRMESCTTQSGRLWLAAWVLGKGSCLVGGVQLGDPSLVSLGFCTVFRGKVVLGYTETELCRRGSGYQFVHAADMMHCAENHVRSECQGGVAAQAGGGGHRGWCVWGRPHGSLVPVQLWPCRYCCSLVGRLSRFWSSCDKGSPLLGDTCSGS